MSSDLIYDVLYQHEPDHILIQATRRDAARGLLDIERLGQMLRRIRQHIVHKPLDRISPLAVPVMLDIGREPIFGEGRESAMADAADELMQRGLGRDSEPDTISSAEIDGDPDLCALPDKFRAAAVWRAVLAAPSERCWLPTCIWKR